MEVVLWALNRNLWGGGTTGNPKTGKWYVNGKPINDGVLNKTKGERNLLGPNTNHLTGVAKGASLTASFDQNLGIWDISNVTDMKNIFDNCGMSKNNFSATIIGWAKLAQRKGVQPGVDLGRLPYAPDSLHSEGRRALHYLITEHGWKIIAPDDSC